MSDTATVSASEIDKAFDRGEDMRAYFDFEHPRVVTPTKSKKVSLTMPEWLIRELDSAADVLAISRNAVINVWLAERLQQEASVPQSVQTV